jgi:multidrug transporter EmrE-like cation transporter
MTGRDHNEPLRPYVAIAATVVLTVYGQGVVKWRVDDAVNPPPGVRRQLEWALDLALQPWVLTAGVAVILGSLAWLAALAQLDLSVAYPLLSVSLVLVVFLGVVAFDEPLSAPKVAGALLVVAGLVLANRSQEEHDRADADRPEAAL